jgi:transcriptional regulator with XRE-family HTH domain
MHSPVHYSNEMQLDQVTTAIGANLRATRVARGWSLEQLASRAGLSRRLLIQVERGQANPTVASLLALSDALGVGLPQLVAVAEQPMVVRAGCAPTLWRGRGGGHAELLSGTGPPQVVELWEWHLGPGDRHASGPHAEGTREMLQVQEGVLQLEVGDHAEVLGAGDTASFAGHQPHAYACDQPARFSLVVFQPDVGRR